MNDSRPSIEEELKDLWDLVDELENVSQRLRIAADKAVDALRNTHGGVNHA